ncbi:MAG: hypothetical protein FWG00_05560 [Coriobacteriia bacterium]|nr:hypothetical protein [Coriobacteriia bacterium]
MKNFRFVVAMTLVFLLVFTMTPPTQAFAEPNESKATATEQQKETSSTVDKQSADKTTEELTDAQPAITLDDYFEATASRKSPNVLSDYLKEVTEDETGIISVLEGTGLSEKQRAEELNALTLEMNDGSYTTYLFEDEIKYWQDDEVYYKETTIEAQANKNMKSSGYGFSNGTNDYRINFSEDPTRG